MPLRGVPVTWEVFNKAFLYRFLHRENREDKVVDLLNIIQGGMSVI